MKKLKRFIPFAMILAIALGIFSCPTFAATETKLSDKTYYHFDLGVVYSFNKGSIWGTPTFGDRIQSTQSIEFGQNVEVQNVYSYVGSSYSIDKGTHNIPKDLLSGSADASYQKNYGSFTTTSMKITNYSSKGNKVTFTYDALLGSERYLEVVDKGINNQDNKIYELFGGKAAMAANNPKVEATVTKALEYAHSGTAGTNKLFLTFIPTVIEYKKYETVEVGEIVADLDTPETVKQNESFNISDASRLESNLTLKDSKVRYKIDNGEYQDLLTWQGTGQKGKNSGGSKSESYSDICTITYEITATATNGQSDVSTKKVKIIDSREVEGEALLHLPPQTYEGHTVEAEDRSTFTVDGKSYNARQAYEEGAASNRFTVESSANAKVSKTSKTTADITFPKKGEYDVTLNVTIKTNGSKLSDTKPIEVLKTPTILANLQGVQKQNRKQLLVCNIAQNPEYPIKEVWIEIQKKDGTEKVHLSHYHNGTSFDESKNTLQNSSIIKTRAIDQTSSTKEWLTVELPFLTKNTRAEEFTYTVFAKDTKGDTDKVTVDFTVVPDEAPVAKISLADTYLRDEKTDFATVIAEDISTTDGDQLERNWTIKTEYGDGTEQCSGKPLSEAKDYQDLSFGTKQKVSFKKTGVGKATFLLEVTDRWTEETLPEYITEADYLKASAEATTDIVNIAPKVSLNPIKTTAADVLILAAGDSEYNELKSSENSIKEKLIEESYDPSIEIVKIKEPSAEAGYELKEVASYDAGYNTGFMGDGKWVSTDDNAMYTIHATWKESKDAYPEPPWIIEKIQDKKKVWSYTIEEEKFPIGTGQINNAGFRFDDKDKYVFFTYNDKTLMLSKDTGSMLTVLNIGLSTDNYLNDNSSILYTVKSDGIYAVSMTTGNVRKVYNGTIATSLNSLKSENSYTRKIEGLVHFVVRAGDNDVKRGYFDVNTEKITFLNTLAESDSDYHKAEYNCLGIDSEGTLILSIDWKEAYLYTKKGSQWIKYSDPSKKVRVYTKDNALIYDKLIYSNNEYYYNYNIGAVYDEKEKCEYLFDVTYTHRSGGTYYYSSANVYNLRSSEVISSGQHETKGNSNRGGICADPSMLMVAKKVGDNIYIQTGASYIQISGGDYGSTYDHYGDMPYLFTFNVNSRSGSYRYAHGDFTDGSIGERGTTSNNKVAVSHIMEPWYTNKTGNQVAKALSWNKNIDEILYENIKEKADKSAKLRTVIIYDNTNAVNLTSLPNTENLISDLSLETIYLSKTDMDNYSKSLLSSLENNGLNAKSITDENPINMLAKTIAENKISSNRTLYISPSDKDKEASISKIFNLAPNREYYYEYSYKLQGDETSEQIFNAESIVENLSDSEDKYYVTDVEIEDFNDSDVNGYFTLSSTSVAGMDRIEKGGYLIATMRNFYSSRNSDKTDKNTITFEVPDGKEAVLVIDYRLELYDNMICNMLYNTSSYGMFLTVDGKSWEEKVGQYLTAHSGIYMHDKILTSGKHTINASMKAYTNSSIENNLYIDKIQVIYIDKNAKRLDTKSTSISSESDSGYIKEKGIINSNADFLSYSGVQYTTTNKTLNKDSGEFSETQNGVTISHSNKTVTVEKNTAYPLKTTISTYSGAGASGQKFILNNQNKSVTITNETKTNIDWYFPFSNISSIYYSEDGEHSYRYKTYSYSYFDRISILSVPVSNTSLASQQYFIDEAAGGKVYFADDIVKGTKVTFTVPKGQEMYLKDFKLYYIDDDGNKVYVEDNAFTKEYEAYWTKDNASLSLIKTKDELVQEEQDKLVYKKGELINYGISYSDRESDPSKKQYWKYTHTPFNDGEHPSAAIVLDDEGNVVYSKGTILNQGIDRFYIDGKYTVEHWQEDNTDRRSASSTGYPNYDKISNVESLTFYIEGGAIAPYVKKIDTITQKTNWKVTEVAEGDVFALKIKIDDVDKDVLSLTTEVYRDKKLIYRHNQKDIYPSVLSNGQKGDYPDVVTGYITQTLGGSQTAALSGNYSVVCTVRDSAGVGIGTHAFKLITPKIDGSVIQTSKIKSGYGITARVTAEAENTSTSKVIATLPDGKKVTMVQTETNGDTTTWEFPKNTGEYADKWYKKYNTVSRQVFVPVMFPDKKYYNVTYKLYDSSGVVRKELIGKTYVDGNMYDDDITHLVE